MAAEDKPDRPTEASTDVLGELEAVRWSVPNMVERVTWWS